MENYYLYIHTVIMNLILIRYLLYILTLNNPLVMTGFELGILVGYSNRPASVVRPSLNSSCYRYFSESTEGIFSKSDMKVSLQVFLCILHFRRDRNPTWPTGKVAILDFDIESLLPLFLRKYKRDLLLKWP